MGEPFRATRRGLEIRLSADERELLANLFGQLDDLLDDGRPVTDDPFDELAALTGLDRVGKPGGEAPPLPEDPALARLLPEANRDDAEAAAEFRRLTEAGLRSRKRAGARFAAEVLRRDGNPTLGEDDTQTLLKAFTDLRLVLGERLGLKTDDDAARLGAQLAFGVEPYEGWRALAATYELLQFLQESLVQTLMSKRR
jgi:uncharacterized protein DUF2017